MHPKIQQTTEYIVVLQICYHLFINVNSHLMKFVVNALESCKNLYRVAGYTKFYINRIDFHCGRVMCYGAS